ncbi:MAG: LysR family transcriptional regulator [Mesorhizobium sp.]|nr:MAG: LysR family transcriptional regulator [Mesorhizobium sp.]
MLIFNRADARLSSGKGDPWRYTKPATSGQRRCCVTQPALTRAIQKLEAELGGHLFHREHSHLHLTDFARLMQPHRPKCAAIECR